VILIATFLSAKASTEGLLADFLITADALEEFRTGIL
jgi:hypothetical protein